MAACSQMSWLDPALFSDEDASPASTPQREASPPISANEPKNLAAPAVLAQLTIDDIKRLPDVLFCDIVRVGPSSNNQVARIYMLPEHLPCPWPPKGPFAPVTHEDLQVVDLPIDCDHLVDVAADSFERVDVYAVASASESDDAVGVATEFKWRAFEPQTRPFGAKPLCTTVDVAVAAQSGEEDKGNGGVAAAIPVLSTPKATKRKRSSRDVGTDGEAKRLKRTYIKGRDEKGEYTECTTCGERLRTKEERRHSGRCGGRLSKCERCGERISRGDNYMIRRHQRSQQCQYAYA
ncbi:hypothetical protein BDN71DRAFT_1436267 [Pleurotus eryngii]|uniref:Uncharacterized protein n=1 Tax=Pleurotus eryngii TaxID=5323 RepID=A0A9P6DA25_PLEER|nr:hypothetical protein BDN71DRAFT_1436267 [Pleurotus eryngii]